MQFASGLVALANESTTSTGAAAPADTGLWSALIVALIGIAGIGLLWTAIRATRRLAPVKVRKR